MTRPRRGWEFLPKDPVAAPRWLCRFFKSHCDVTESEKHLMNAFLVLAALTKRFEKIGPRRIHDKLKYQVIEIAKYLFDRAAQAADLSQRGH